MTDFPDEGRPKRSGATAPDSLPLLMLAAFPLFFWLFMGSLTTALAAVFHFALLAGGLSLIASGREIEARYRAARAARRPRLPRKIAGSAVLGFATLLLAGNHFSTWTMPLIFGASALVLSLAAFGLDPMRDKGVDDPKILAEQAVAEALCAADETMSALVARVAKLGDADLILRTEAVQSAILRMMRAYATDPEEFAPFQRPLETCLALAEQEVSALETQWATDSQRAARRYSVRIAALSDGFESRARKRRARQDADAFAFEADLLLDRMRENKAA